MMRTEDKLKQFAEDSINKMMEVAGHEVRYSDLMKEDQDSYPPWYSKYTMTSAQRDDLKNWFIKECRRRFKFNKKISEKEFSWFDLMYGLKRVDK